MCVCLLVAELGYGDFYGLLWIKFESFSDISGVLYYWVVIILKFVFTFFVGSGAILWVVFIWANLIEGVGFGEKQLSYSCLVVTFFKGI